jgi:hypothetical protein
MVVSDASSWVAQTESVYHSRFISKGLNSLWKHLLGTRLEETWRRVLSTRNKHVNAASLHVQLVFVRIEP